jgi:CBS domain-containing protein
VVRHGQLVGIVSRGDLVKVLAALAQLQPAESLVSGATPQAGESVAVGSSGAANGRISEGGRRRRGRARRP